MPCVAVHRPRLWSGLLTLLLLMNVARPSAAQVGSGAIVGHVVDEAGAAVHGATVVVTALATNRDHRTSTALDGGFGVPALAPGAYRLQVEHPGFRPLVREGLAVTTGETARVDLRLAIGGVAETLTVTAGASPLRGDAAGLGHGVDQRRIVDLPLNGRTFIALAVLVPGVALPPGSLLPRINGGRPRVNEYLFDGISVLQPEPGQVAFFPTIDAIQEFTIVGNSAPAEFGRFNGGVVNLTTRAGTNAVSGTAFEFFRHEALNARPYFAPTETAPPSFRRHQFGGVAGGPMRRNRTFLFADYQGQRQTIGRTVISTVPTLLQRRGIFTEAVAGRMPVVYDPATTTAGPGGRLRRSPFPSNVIPVERQDALARALLGRYPLPTSAGTVDNYRRVGDEVVDQDQASVRLDHQWADGRDRAFARLTWFREGFSPVTPLPDGSGPAAGALGPQTSTAWAFASSYQRTIAGGLLSELRVGDTRRSVARTAAPIGGIGLSGVPGASLGGRFADILPTFAIAGYQQLGSPPNTATNFSTGVRQVAETITWLRGRHTAKIGADLRWTRLDVVQPPSPAGAYVFSSLFTDLPGTTSTGHPLASFLLGQVQQFSIDLQQQPIRPRAHTQEYFVQDDWRVSERMTVNAGLRYTLNFPSHERDNQAAVFNRETGALDFLGRDGRPRSSRRLHTHNLGPRVGVVFRPEARTVIRAGYGLVWIDLSGITTPFTTPVFPFLQTVSERTLDGVTPAFTLADGPRVTPVPMTPDAGLGQGVFAVDRDLGSGFAQQWHASVQRELPGRFAAEVGYAGSVVTRVGLPDANINQLTVEQLALGPALLERVPNPFFGVIPRASSLGDPTLPVAQLLKPYPRHTTVSLYRNNVGTTRYQGVFAALQRRAARGLSASASYTRSRLLDDASSVFDASILTGPVGNAPVADGFDRRRERDVSTGDIPHVFTASVVWTLPAAATGHGARLGRWMRAFGRNWTASAFLTLQSGMPVAVTQATNHNAFAGFGIQRPNLVGTPTLPAAQRSTDRWFDTSAFAEAPVFTLGSASRNPVRGPGYRNLDVGLTRLVPLGRRASLDVRLEAFNVTNTPALGSPNGVFGSPAFGRITTAGDPRVLQLAAKIRF
jgi:Carboxypeptidase regulatory-like domain/TonB dependent receptor